MKRPFNKMLKAGLFFFTILVCFNVAGQSSIDTTSIHNAVISLPEKFNHTVTKLADGSYSNPVWSTDGKHIAFTNKEQSGIMMMNKEGADLKVLTTETGAGYKFTWSLDNSHIAYRGTRFEANKRTQFIGLVNVKDTLTKILVFQNRMQPPVWQYSAKGKCLAYIINDKVSVSDLYPYASEKDVSLSEIPDINTFFYYKEGFIYLINNNTLTENTEKIKGMDPVISPDRKNFIYSSDGQLHLRSFNDNTEVNLGYGSHPSWSPDGLHIVFQKTTDDGHVITGADLFIMNLSKRKAYPLTSTSNVFEVNPAWSPDGKNIVFNDENDGDIYLITFN